MKLISAESLPQKVDYTPHFWITLPDSTKLAASLWLPVTAERHPVPALLEYNSDCRRHGSSLTDSLNQPYLAGHGYACIRVDIRGIGDSDGEPQDPLSTLLIDDAVAVIDWISKQPWCSGAVGMFGLSWGATTALRVAARRPSALNAIVSICGTDDPYLDGTYYKGGVLIPELTLDNVDVQPADPAIVTDQWQEHWLSRLEASSQSIHQPIKHALRDEYWQAASLMETPSAINIPILYFSGWHDPHINANIRMFNTFKAPMKCVLGPWGTQYPHIATPGPNIGLLQEMLDWFGCFLKQESFLAEQLPNIRFFMMNAYRPSLASQDRVGMWYQEPCWPPGQHINDTLYMQDQGLRHEKSSDPLSIDLRSPEITGIDNGDYEIAFPDQPFQKDQSEEDARSYSKDTLPFNEDYIITGAPVFECLFSSSEPHAQLHVRLCAVSPRGESTLITHGLLDLSHDESHKFVRPLDPDRLYQAKIRLNEVAYTVPRGHRLRMALSTRSWTVFLPSPMPSTITLLATECYINIPITRVALTPLSHPLPEPEATEPEDSTIIDEPVLKFIVKDNAEDHEYIQKKDYNYGKAQSREHQLITAFHKIVQNKTCKTGVMTETIIKAESLTCRRGTRAFLSVRSGIIGYPDRICMKTIISATLNDRDIYTREWKGHIDRGPEIQVTNKQAIAYLNYITRLCHRCHIKVRAIPDGDVNTNTFNPQAPGGPNFRYATGSQFSDWFPAMLTEFQHVEQWIEKFEPYMNQSYQQKLLSWIERRSEMSADKVHKAILQAIALHRDACVRTLKAIYQYNLPIDAKQYAKTANSLLYSYQYIERYRQWPSLIYKPYMKPEIMADMPEDIVQHFDAVDEDIMALYVETFPPGYTELDVPSKKNWCIIL